MARFFYLHEGTGTPVVLISPGDSPAYAWHNQLSVLAAAGHSVYVVDLPGQGRTVLHDSSFGWDLPAMTSALASFLDAVHLQRTALVGNSWSGGWAVSFAQRYPHRVSRLALLDSSGLDVPDIWAWRVFKISVLGELLANFDVTRGSVRGFLNLAVYHRGLVTAEMVNEFWAPATYRVNRLATVLLERRLDWGQTQALPGSTTARPPGSRDPASPGTRAASWPWPPRPSEATRCPSASPQPDPGVTARALDDLRGEVAGNLSARSGPLPGDD